MAKAPTLVVDVDPAGTLELLVALDQLARQQAATIEQLTGLVLELAGRLDAIEDHLAAAAGWGVCRECGCTDVDACNPPCWWVDVDLCSACAGIRSVVDLPDIANYQPQEDT